MEARKNYKEYKMDSARTSITTLEAVIDLAIVMESHGRDYYAKARDKATDPKCKEFFAWLVDQEDDHHQTYLHLIENSSFAEISPEEISVGYGHFIQRLVKEVTESLKESENLSMDEAFEQSIFFEESVIEYFEKVMSLFPEEQAKVIQIICDEEKVHIDAINQYKAENNI
jgi:rubrerythrin